MAEADAGVAYVQLLPSMRGFSAAASRGMSEGLRGPSRDAGERSGRSLADGIGSGVDRARGTFSSAAGRIGDIFKSGLAAAGVGGAALLAAGFSSALDRGDATARLSAQLGGAEFGAEMGAIAGRLYSEAFGDSVADVGAGLRDLFEAGLIDRSMASADIEAISTRFLTFTDVMEQDMEGATRAVSRMLQTGIADSSEEALNVLVAGLQGGADQAGDLLDSFAEYSVQFDALGLSAAEATGLMMQGLKGGARDADTVADALKELAIRGKDMSTASAEGFALLGLNAGDMVAAFAAGGPAARAATVEVIDAMQGLESQSDRNAAAYALFGTKSEDLQAALSALDPDTAAAGLGELEGLMDGLSSAYETNAMKLEEFKRKGLERLTNFVGGTVVPALTGLAAVLGPPIRAALDQVMPVIGQVVDGWTTLVAAFQGGDDFGATGIAGFMAQIGLAARELAPIVTSVLGGLQAFGAWAAENSELIRGALTGIAVAITALLVPALYAMVAPLVAALAPFLAIVAVAAAVGAGLMWLYNNVDGFRSLVDEAIPKVVAIFQDGFALLQEIVRVAVAVLGEAWRLWGDEILAVARIVWDLVSGVISGALDVIGGVVRLFLAVLRGDWSGAWDAIKQILSGAWRIIWSVISAGVRLAWQVIKAGFELIKAVIGTQITLAKELIRRGIDQIVSWWRALPGRIRSGISSLAGVLTSPFRNAFNEVKRLWNRTLGGFSFSVPDWVPQFGGKKFSIPKMHTGGIVPGPGETPILARAGEGLFTAEQMAALAPAGAGGAVPVPAAERVVISADGDRYFMRWLQHSVRVEYGGDPIRALGGRA